MKRLVTGILAHVDAGKTTLSEAMLYHCGCVRSLGRVDHQTAFLDTFSLERERGITIFSKQAILPMGDMELTLLDTPGHVDFSSEMERTLQVLDYAILVLSGPDGVQSHTTTLWKLLAHYQVPTFLFVNKMDQPGAHQATVMQALRQRLDDRCADFTQPRPALDEQAATGDEQALEHYLEHGALSDDELGRLIAQRKLFPCYFGCALRLEGLDDLFDGLARFTRAPHYPDAFGATVYKISRDPQGTRLTHLKITGGSLTVKEPLLLPPGTPGDAPAEEKVDQIRLYSGAKYLTTPTATPGMVCAVTGLSGTYPGQTLGGGQRAAAPVLEPLLTYQLILPDDCPPHTALPKLRLLEEEDPQLRLQWRPATGALHVQLMGPIQLEVLRQVIHERFGLAVTFGPGSIIYKETIAAPVEGVGHFEPLRHYAEVHLLLEPGPPGSGLHVASTCSQDDLSRNWQRLVLTHLQEKVHVGVLTGAPITDMRITLTAGRAHAKHTEGGDFREATYRAVRQGLCQAESVLLEPWYQFYLDLPAAAVGRAMSDLQRMGATFAPPETGGDTAILTGQVPVAALADYAAELSSYTRGQGRLHCTPAGYRPCHNADAVIAAAGYDHERDTENPSSSVFCAHGTGFVVPWNEVHDHMHLPLSAPNTPPEPELPAQDAATPRSRTSRGPSLEQDKQLLEIFERTYGPVKQRAFLPQSRPAPKKEAEAPRLITIPPPKEEYLLVDGYNIIFAWDELKSLASDNIDAARTRLMDILCNYQAYRSCHVILVFDAYKVPRGTQSVSRYQSIDVVYTKHAETADTYIERATYTLGKDNRVRVATSDYMEQLIILGHGARRVSAAAFYDEVQQVNRQISEQIALHNRTQAEHLQD